MLPNNTSKIEETVDSMFNNVNETLDESMIEFEKT